MPATRVLRLLNVVERAGNLLPHPASLFVILSLLVIAVSAAGAALNFEAVHPGTKETVRAVSLLTVEGLHRIVTQMVTNFTSFAPLGTVLVAMLGIAVAEGSGLIAAALKLLVLASPRRLLTTVIVFSGVMSNMASEIGYVLLVPLAAIVFAGAGRHPLAGIAAAFAGVSGGYSANLLLGTVDPLLAGLTEEAARIVDPSIHVNPSANYYFMVASTFVVTLAGVWVTERIVIPRLGPWSGEKAEADALNAPLTRAERRGLVWAAIAGAAFTAVLLGGTVPQNGFLRDATTGSLLRSPFMSGIVAFIFLGGLAVGGAYGIAAGTLRRDVDFVKAMSRQMETLGSYLVLVFFASQFVAFFNWTNLGLILAVRGAETLQASGLGGIPLIVGFVVLTSSVNLLIGSASAKWAIMAPVFVPMFMLLGYSPELTQAAYRVGDSVSNVISPTMSYFALIVAFAQRYDPRAGIGTIAATMLPYTVVFLIVWGALLAGWYAFGLPLGPGAGLVYPAAS